MNESTLVPREEISDLDWLARNVHVWKGCDWSVLTRNHDYWLWLTKESCKDAFLTKDQWLARRAELQNKPSWNDAPEWAVALAQDSALEDGLGAWWWYEIEPTTCNRTWNNQGHAYPSILRGEVLGEWRDTLEKRPEKTIVDICGEVTQENRHEQIFEPFVSVEDAATAKQPAPKGSGNPILGMVLADLTNRALGGKEKYGEPLLAHNGRNPLWDAYQEALDLAMYLRQAIEEQK